MLNGKQLLNRTLVLGGVLTIGLVASACSSGLPEAEEASLRRDVVELTDANASLTQELSEATATQSTANQQMADLESLSKDQGTSLTEAADRIEAAENSLEAATKQFDEARTSLKSTRVERDKLQALVAQLTLAYDSEISSALETVAAEALPFVCRWGAQKAIDGAQLSEITGRAALIGFLASDTLAALKTSQNVVAAIEMATTLGENPYGVSEDEMGATAIGCWQSEDAKINAVLYVDQQLYRDAVLDAACTEGASGAYTNLDETAVYRSWELSVGDDYRRSYESSITEKFGSMQAFLGIPPSDLESADARCADIRDLIEPKHSGTWNVGDEIKAGTWKAFDVSDCYWARLAENGNIRANQFGDGLRLSVNVSSSDGQFEISGCTFYYANP